MPGGHFGPEKIFSLPPQIPNSPQTPSHNIALEESTLNYSHVFHCLHSTAIVPKQKTSELSLPQCPLRPDFACPPTTLETQGIRFLNPPNPPPLTLQFFSTHASREPAGAGVAAAAAANLPKRARM